MIDGILKFTNADYQAVTSLLALSDLENGITLHVSTCSSHHSFPCILSLNSVLDARTLSISPITFVSFHFEVSSLLTILFLLCSSHQTPCPSHLTLESSTMFSKIAISQKMHLGNVPLGLSPHNESFVVSGEEEMALIWKFGGSMFKFEVWGQVPAFSSILCIDMTALPHDISQHLSERLLILMMTMTIIIPITIYTPLQLPSLSLPSSLMPLDICHPPSCPHCLPSSAAPSHSLFVTLSLSMFQNSSPVHSFKFEVQPPYKTSFLCAADLPESYLQAAA